MNQNTATPALYEKVEITFQLSETYTNPFDPDEVDARALITDPDSNVIEIPAFFYMEFDAVGTMTESYINGRDPSWKVRFAPEKIGAYSFDLEVVDLNGTASLVAAGAFTAFAGAAKGFVRVSPDDSRFFAYDDGSTYFPIGENVGWSDDSGTIAYNTYFTALGGAGANFVRIWMTHFYTGQTIEWSASHFTGYFDGLGVYSLEMGWKLDRIVELAEANGLAIQLTLQHHGQFSTTVNPNWDENPFNSANAADGGFLASPTQFFTNATAIDLTKWKYRYIVARWGYSPAIFAWELFNEVQFTDDFRTSAAQRVNVTNWHGTMSDYIASIDAFDHPITTSSDDAENNSFVDIWNLPNIDIVEMHNYQPNKIPTFLSAIEDLSAYGKPVLIGEYGADGKGAGTPETNPGGQGEPDNTQILEGLVLHNGLWSTALQGSGAMYWWWDNYIQPLNLYSEFTPLSLFVADENFAQEGLAEATISLGSGIPVTATGTPGIAGFFSASTQTTFAVDAGGAIGGMANLSQYLHGNFQNALRSDPTFTVNALAGSELRIHIDEVSAAGSNSLRVLDNGAQIFATTGDQSGMTNYTIAVPLTNLGQRSIRIENTGDDWFDIDYYEFVDVGGSLLSAIGLAAPTKAYVWIYDTGSQFRLNDNGTFSGESATIAGLSDGVYQVDAYATRGAGGVISTQFVASASGSLVATLPDFTKDIALKISPQSVPVAASALVLD